ncbi:molybdopterin-binding protein [Leucobacter soli]|uniref:molybdopterin-binding protein n=1 Tax=Leucobacter soli TaxID=2812850 RepID=UPI00360CF078
MTGAAIPIGADAVIPIELADPPRFGELRRAGDPAPQGSVRFVAAPAPAEFVRTAGSDLPAGAILLDAGVRLTPSRIGLLANAGVRSVPVRPKPRILLVSTGDEVSAPGEPLAPGRIYDANTPLLASALRGAGADVEVCRVSDSPDALRRLVVEEGSTADVLVTSGGISAGAYEVVREALAGLGAEFTGLALQPGGPQGCGGLALPGGGSLPALCFPGNPVSSALSAELFLLPCSARTPAGRHCAPPSTCRSPTRSTRRRRSTS